MDYSFSEGFMSDAIDCDLLVIGAGMAGLSAAALAAERGARVIVIEKAAEIGGSAILSGGYVWTVPSLKHMAMEDDGDSGLSAVIINGYAEALAWLRQRGVVVSGMLPVLHGRGYQVDIISHLRACSSVVDMSGGHVVTNTVVERLDTDSCGRVVGAETRHPDGLISVRSEWTLLATGGFQASPALCARHIGPKAAHLLLRSNPNSCGDGLALAEGVGAVYAGPNSGFYGHLLCHPAVLDAPTKFVRYAQLHSPHALLLDRNGERFCDESRGDHFNAQEVFRLTEPEALLIWDDHVHQQHVLTPYTPTEIAEDKLDIALAAGSRAAKCSSLDEVAKAAHSFGYSGEKVVSSLLQYNEAARASPETLKPARTANVFPLEQAPFRLLVVKSGITFTHGGIRIDDQARALDATGRPIPGLLVAGVDAGNIYRRGYAGGLSLALTFAMRAVATAGF